MATYRNSNPMFAMRAVEPYEQVGDQPRISTSPDELRAYYQEMEQKEIVERKLSKRASLSGSFWSRKRSKRASSIPNQDPKALRRTATNYEDDKEKEMEKVIHARQFLPAIEASRSIVPDVLPELPAWYNKDTWSSPSFYKSKFALHEPSGPRYYRNHHLVPAEGGRPPTIFSPVFPAMAPSISQERSQDSSRTQPAKTPAHSPVQSPSSSETRVAEGDGKTRSRKPSLTAHDTVDMLDVSDPWGTNWHHGSPYDIGLSNGSVSPEVENSQPRSRRASLTATKDSKRRTITPSPLSQSTSAIHLQVQDGERLPRKLSKRRASSRFDVDPIKPGASSLPVSPEPIIQSAPPVRKHSSFVPMFSPSTSPTPKKERRGSILGRIAKKFSLIKKPADHQRDSQQWQHVSPSGAETSRPPSIMPPSRQPSPDKASQRRVPPPSIVTTPPRRESLESLESPFPMGKLTVANPDTPSETNSTPVQAAVTLPTVSPEPRQSHVVDSPSESSQHVLASPPTLLSSPEPVHVPSNEFRPLSNLDLNQQPSEIPQRLSQAVLENQTSPAPSEIISSPQMRAISPEIPPKASRSSHHSRKQPSESSSRPVEKASSTSHHERRSTEQEHNRGHSEKTSSTSHHERRSTEQERSWGHSTEGPRPTEKVAFPSQSPPEQERRRSKEQERSKRQSVDAPKSSEKRLTFPSQSSSSHPDHGRAGSSFMEPTPRPIEKDSRRESRKHSRSPEKRASSSNPAVPSKGKQSQVPARESILSPDFLSSMLTAQMFVDSSPLSAASILVNPPTPHSDLPISLEPDSSPPALPPKSDKRDPSPSSTTGRQTETFRLVRSSSGNVYASSETIHVAGEQWEVMESSSKSKSRDGRSSVQKHIRESSREKPLPQRANSAESRRSAQPQSRNEPGPSLRDKPPAPPPKPTPRPDRNQAASARPISEVPTSADLNALRAKEVWDMERLWKARSLYGADLNGLAAAPVTTPSGMVSPEEHPIQRGGHGSSHTSFRVQNSFQAQPAGSHIYHSMPTAPPPIIYSSTPSLQQYGSPYPDRPASYSSTDVHSSSSRPALSNPLPEPPRESSYQPAPLTTILDSSSSTSTEYWSKYAGVTAA